MHMDELFVTSSTGFLKSGSVCAAQAVAILADSDSA